MSGVSAGLWGRSLAMRVVIAASALVAVGGLSTSPAEGAGSTTGPNRPSLETSLTSLPPPADNLGEFGSNVAISESTAVVVASHTEVPNAQGGFEEGQGQVFIYTSNDGNWSLTPATTLSAPDTTGGFGSAVAVSGSTVVVSDIGVSPASVYIYSAGSDGWPSTPTVTLTDPAWYPGDPWNDGFGQSLSIAGRTLFIGAQGGDGMVYEYTEGNGGWPTSPTLRLFDPGSSSVVGVASNDEFGETLDVSGTTAMIGAYQSGGNGKPLVYEYTEDAGGWTPTSTLTLADPTGHGCFGGAEISISGTSALIGGGCEHPSSGAVYVYKLRKSGWSSKPVATFHDPARQVNSYFGTAEAVSGDTALVGAWGFNHRVGRAYVYSEGRDGIWHTTPSGVVTAPTPVKGGWFGNSLGLSGGTAIIGALGADPNHATGASGLAFLYQQ
jgi:hypothetical protein